MKKILTSLMIATAIIFGASLYGQGMSHPGRGGHGPIQHGRPGVPGGPGVQPPRPAVRPPAPAPHPAPRPPHPPHPAPHPIHPAPHPVPPVPHVPHGHRTFPHRHPASKFLFSWYECLPGARVYAPAEYVIYECRNCHAVRYSPVLPPAEACPVVIGQTHVYQVLGHYGDLAFRCATCGVSINSSTVPNTSYCGIGAAYHVWQQLLEY